MNSLPICIATGCTCIQTFLKHQQEERLVQFLMKLDNKFANVRSNILVMQPLPSLSLAYKLLIQEEKQRQTSLADDENNSRPMAFAVDHIRLYKQQNYGSRMTFQTGVEIINSLLQAKEMLLLQSFVNIARFLVIQLTNVIKFMVILQILVTKGREERL